MISTDLLQRLYTFHILKQNVQGLAAGSLPRLTSLEKEQIQWILLKIKALVEHIKIFDKELLKPGIKNYDVMKKHFKAYINGFNGAKELREKLMGTKSPKESILILNTFQKTFK